MTGFAKGYARIAKLIKEADLSKAQYTILSELCLIKARKAMTMTEWIEKRGEGK